MSQSEPYIPPFGVFIAAATLALGVFGLLRGAPVVAPLPLELVDDAVVRAPGVDDVASAPARFEPPWTRGVSTGAGAVITRGATPRPASEFVESARANGWIRWDLVNPPASTAGANRYVFGEHLAEARVSVGEGDARRQCGTWLFGRWQCGPHPWNYVGSGEVSVRGRTQQCIWAHPSDEGPVSIAFDDVPLGNLISGRHMLADVGVSNTTPGDVRLRVWMDETLLGERTQTQRRGLNTFRFPISDPPDRASVRFEIDADVTAQRHFCFTAQARRTPSRDTTPSLGRPAPAEGSADSVGGETPTLEGSAAPGSEEVE